MKIRHKILLVFIGLVAFLMATLCLSIFIPPWTEGIDSITG